MAIFTFSRLVTLITLLLVSHTLCSSIPPLHSDSQFELFARGGTVGLTHEGNDMIAQKDDGPPQIPITTTQSVVTQTPSVFFRPKGDDGNKSEVVSRVEVQSIAYNIPLHGFDKSDDYGIHTMCWYPVSGYYSRLARILFYCTLLFAAFSRRHSWLIMGALAAGLTYSGAAAVHMCLLLLSGRARGNTDVYAGLGLMIFSGAMLVPLLNWSRTIRRWGEGHEEDSPGRSVIIYWGFLIMFAFLCLFVAIWDTNVNAFLFTRTFKDHLTCAPESGLLDLTAGQDPDWKAFIFTSDFLEANNCNSACITLPNMTIFRSPDSLQLPSLNQLQHFIPNFQSDLSDEGVLHVGAANLFLTAGSLLFFWNLLQVTTVVFFGRRSPREIRNVVYMRLLYSFKIRPSDMQKPDFDMTFDSGKYPKWDMFAKLVAIIFYLWTCLASASSILLLIVSVPATEYFMALTPQGQDDYEVDSWAPWVATVLVLFTALLYNFEGMVDDSVIRLMNLAVKGMHSMRHGESSGERRQSLALNPRPHKITGNVQTLLRMIRKFIAGCRPNMGKLRASHGRIVDDLTKFLSPDAQKYVHRHLGGRHLMDHRAMVAETQKVAKLWEKDDGGSHWLDVETFTERCKEFESDKRRSDDHCDVEYLWQARYIRSDRMHRRQNFERDLFLDIFRRRVEGASIVRPEGQASSLHNSTSSSHASVAEAPPAPLQHRASSAPQFYSPEMVGTLPLTAPARFTSVRYSRGPLARGARNRDSAISNIDPLDDNDSQLPLMSSAASPASSSTPTPLPSRSSSTMSINRKPVAPPSRSASQRSQMSLASRPSSSASASTAAAATIARTDSVPVSATSLTRLDRWFTADEEASPQTTRDLGTVDEEGFHDIALRAPAVPRDLS